MFLLAGPTYETLPMVTILPACQREIDALPIEVREDLADALARLDNGLNLSMPLSRALFAITKGLYELRLRDRTGAYRIFLFYEKAK